MEIPKPPFVALYGSHGTPWRATLAQQLSAVGIRWYDPTDSGWATIGEGNGDVRQGDIDDLVDKQHLALERAAAVVIYLGAATPSHAARAEVAYLAGRNDTPTFVFIEPATTGRNYLWAVIERYASMHRCQSLQAALDAAIGSIRSRPVIGG